MFELSNLADWLTIGLLKLPPESHLASAVDFFIYDTIKIFLLLIIITHFMSLVRHYLPIERIRAFLTSKKFYGLDYFLATIFGSITPFCSCSSIPLFIGFLQAGIPLGVTFAFLITSPLINEIALTLFISIFGLKITVMYLLAGIIIGMAGGWILGKLKMDKYVADFIQKRNSNSPEQTIKSQKPMKVASQVSKEAFGIVKKVGLFILIGIAVGAVIHGYVPQGFFEQYLKQAGIFAVPLAVVLAVPIYSNASGVIPILQALVAKGVPIGTALAFMMAIVGLSLPEGLMLKRVLRLPLLLTFFGIVTLGIIIIGYIFNFILG